jgi:AcrR family transcriptional regulator
MGRRKLVEDDELLAVARGVFVEKGIAASTREIARRAGISEAVIYQRHPTNCGCRCRGRLLWLLSVSI